MPAPFSPESFVPATTAPMAAARPLDPVVASTIPPDVVVPAPPPGFEPVNFDNYRGLLPIAALVTAAPDAAAEIAASTAYASTFGSSAPPASRVADGLSTAARWSALRMAGEAFVLYARSFEAITWKAARADIEKLDALFRAIESQDLPALAAFPATRRLLAVPKVIAARGVTTRRRLANAAKAKQATTNAPPVPPSPASPTPTTRAESGAPEAG